MVLGVRGGSAGTARPDIAWGQMAPGFPPLAALSPPSMRAKVGRRLLGPSVSRSALLASRASGLGFTANSLVSANAASLSRSQAEPSIASNPLNRNVMVVGYSDSVTPDNVAGVSRSTDGGKSWAAPSGGALLPNPPGLTWGSRASV